jgi:glucose/arabinose dehydrogenase
MPSKAIVCAATALVLLISTGTFAQTQSSFTSTVGGTGSSSTSSSSSAIGISTSSEQQEQQQQQQQQLQEEGAGFQPQEQPQQPEAPAVSLSTDTRQVQPFSTIALCAPINLRILPNTTFSTPEDAYAFIISAEEEILSQIQSEVGPEGVLAITAAGPFTTNQTVQLTVSLPPDALHAIVHSGPSETKFFFYLHICFQGSSIL